MQTLGGMDNGVYQKGRPVVSLKAGSPPGRKRRLKVKGGRGDVVAAPMAKKTLTVKCKRKKQKGFNMTSLTETTSITQALEALEREKWLPHLEELLERFAGFEYEQNAALNKELEVVLWDIVAVFQRSDEAPFLRLLHRRISELECWHYRAMRTETSGAQLFWNPLEEKYIDFKQAGTTHCYMADSGYPARDVIRKWCEQRLK